jgi:hypothetical protein
MSTLAVNCSLSPHSCLTCIPAVSHLLPSVPPVCHVFAVRRCCCAVGVRDRCKSNFMQPACTQHATSSSWFCCVFAVCRCCCAGGCGTGATEFHATSMQPAVHGFVVCLLCAGVAAPGGVGQVQQNFMQPACNQHFMIVLCVCCVQVLLRRGVWDS